MGKNKDINEVLRKVNEALTHEARRKAAYEALRKAACEAKRKIDVAALDEVGEALREVIEDLHKKKASAFPANRKRMRVFSPPGKNIGRVLRILFSKKTFDNIFAQAISDMREEYYEALANGEKWKARIGHIRDNLWIILSVLAYLAVSVGKRAIGIWNIIS